MVLAAECAERIVRQVGLRHGADRTCPAAETS
jgi:hypothetical protein